MQLPNYVQNLMHQFPNSFINRRNELIIIPQFNVYFNLTNVNSKEDVQGKLCEFLSRDCCKSMRYDDETELHEYWQHNTDLFNLVCGTQFSIDDMYLIYDRLGNGIHPDLTKQFVNSGFDLNVLNPNSVFWKYV